MAALFQRLGGRFRKRPPRKTPAGLTGLSPSRRLHVEPLEDRRLLSLDLGWAFALGGTGADVGRATATDTDGNVYVAGRFEGTMDFDPGPGTMQGTGDGFVAKYTPGGALVWAQFMTGPFPDLGGLTVDKSGNVYLAGATATSVGRTDAFVMKVNSAGSMVWVRTLGTSMYAAAAGIGVDDAGNVYTTGHFSGSADFGSGRRSSTGGRDVFVWKLNSTGNLVWARTLGGTQDDQGAAVALDQSGNVHLAGSFFGTVDFDPGAGTSFLTSAGWDDVFVLKLDVNGNFRWVRRLGGTPTETAADIAVDPDGNVYTAGHFWGDGDFDPGPGIATLSSAGEEDAFLSKLDSSGTHVWARRWGGPQSDRAMRLALGPDKSIYATGFFHGTADFDPGAGTVNLTSAGQSDIFLATLDAAGGFVWAGRTGGSGADLGLGVAVDADGNVYTSGSFEGTVDFDPGAATFNRTSNGGSDGFLSKLVVPALPPVDLQLLEFTAAGTTASLTYEIVGQATQAFTIGIYRSTDARYQPADLLLGTVPITSTADLTTGRHVKTIGIGSGAGMIPLPGAGAAETATEYYLLAVADPAGTITEPDADPVSEDNTAVFAGTYHPAGGGVFVHGTAAGEAFTIAPGSVVVSIDGRPQTYVGGDVTGARIRAHDGNDTLDFRGGPFGTSQALTFLFIGGRGGNSAALTGTAGASATLRPGRATLTAIGFSLAVYGSGRITVTSGGDGDKAVFYDSAGYDRFYGYPAYASMAGDGFENRVNGFDKVYAYATAAEAAGVVDRAWFYDSKDANTKFYGYPTYAYITGSGFYNYAKGFDKVFAYATADDAPGVVDTAYLYDSKDADTKFYGYPAYAYITGAGFYHYTKGFDKVFAYATAADAAGVVDRAYLNDTPGNDHLQAASDWAKLYANDGSLDLLYQATGFDLVRAYHTTGTDTSHVMPEVKFLQPIGTWDSFNLVLFRQFLTDTDALIESARAYLDQRVAAGRTNAIQETIAFLRARTTMSVGLSSNGAMILVTSPLGFSRGMITDAPDRPDWLITQAAGTQTQWTAARTVSLAAAEGGVSSAGLKNNNAIVVVPHDWLFFDEAALANQLREKFASAGIETTIVGEPAGGPPVTVDTMRSLGDYGVVVFVSHGGVGSPAQANGTSQTIISSGQAASLENLNAVQARLGAGTKERIAVTGSGHIAYTTEFFKDLDFTNTLVIADACHSAESTGTPGGDLMSAVTGDGGTFVGWSGTVFSDMMENSVATLADSLAKGRSVQEALQDVHSDPALQLEGRLVHLLGLADIDQLVLGGHGDLKITPSPATLSIDDAEVVEGNDGSRAALFLVSLSQPLSYDVTFEYWTNSGSANYNDFTSVVATPKTIPAGTTSVPVLISVQGDYVDESDEDFFVHITPVTAGIPAARDRGAGLIRDDDTAGVVFDVNDTITTEAGKTVSFGVKLASRPTDLVTILLVSEDASEGEILSTNLQFSPDDWNQWKPVVVRGLDDNLVDGDVGYRIILSGAVSDDPKYGAMDVPDVSLVNRDNDVQTPKPWQIVVQVVGDGYVTDHLGRIDTRTGDNVGDYTSTDYAVYLYASDVWTDWRYNGWYLPNTYTIELLPDDFRNGVTVIAEIGWNELTAEGTAPAGGPKSDPLTAEMLGPIWAEAVAWWASLGVGQSAIDLLGRVEVQVADMPDSQLGRAAREVIYLDDDAAGFRWFVDPTPADSDEFSTWAKRGSIADHMDLLTAVLHEQGHILGLADLDPLTAPGDLMSATLRTGIRRLPALSHVDAIYAAGQW
ncbi:MAG: SBBP repeat-containing protein [Pirellulales bacterium]|nr:SBBP repeat-containing protein [Pirellulales bacterium]